MKVTDIYSCHYCSEDNVFVVETVYGDRVAIKTDNHEIQADVQRTGKDGTGEKDRAWVNSYVERVDDQRD